MSGQHQVITLGEDSLRLQTPFLGDAARPLLEHCLSDLPWSQPSVRLYGRVHRIPRLQCWIGDPGLEYQYSGLRLTPEPWPDWLDQARRRVEAACGQTFNSVLCNLYRDGNDAVGWHSDDEPELGPDPMIASLSLGSVRRFRFRHRAGRHPSQGLDLPNDSLLIMPPGLQGRWQHQLPRTRRPVGSRVNLTFRKLYSP